MIKVNAEDYRSIIDTGIREYIGKYTDIDNITVPEAMKYCLFNAGKRIRPMLVLESCRICGGNYMKALPFAVAIEMIHTYSLIHDDLPCMDDDDLRRGKPSCHKAYGEAVAVLAGDALLTAAFNVISSCGIASERPDIAIKAIRALSDYSGVNGMIGGQALDLLNENRSVSAADIDLCNELKTGALLRCAAYLGAVCADADSEKINALDSYASNIGKAFQITDDVLNVVGDEKLLGKTVGSDSINGKSTYVSLLGLDEAVKLAEKLTDEAVGALALFENEADFLKKTAYKLIKRNN